VLSATLTAEAAITFTNSSQSHTVGAYYTSQYTSTSSWNSAPTQLSGPVSQTFTTTSTAPDQNVSWNVTSAVQTDLQGWGWQYTAELVNANEANTTGFVEFGPSATLSITYDHAPGSPQVQIAPSNDAANGSTYTSSLTPAFSANATDADGDEVSYQFQVLHGTTVVESDTTGYTASGSAATWTPTTALSNNTAYSLPR
jgi:hypothetical protein